MLDASTALAWHLERSDAAERRAVEAASTRLEGESATVPALWFAAVANGCLMAERRGLASPTTTAGFLARLRSLPIVVDPRAPAACRDAVLTVARTPALTARAATYLELARSLGAPLATLDRALAQAAGRAGVPAVG